MKDIVLLDVQIELPRIAIELKYATTDNFTGQIIYDSSQCLLRKEAIEQLRQVDIMLESIGLRLKIWDGFRSQAAQWRLWELFPDERYVSDPRKGGRHTRGTAVDLTLITPEGSELPMPTPFDDFSEKAHRSYAGATPEQLANRAFLQTLMEEHGFQGLPTEWWHFDLIGWELYPPL